MKGDLLYDKYSIISEKILRKPESQYKSWISKHKEGKLVKTARGYFLNGYQIDLRSAYEWFLYNQFDKEATALSTPFIG